MRGERSGLVYAVGGRLPCLEVEQKGAIKLLLRELKVLRVVFALPLVARHHCSPPLCYSWCSWPPSLW
jgi:hypothetical protein